MPYLKDRQGPIYESTGDRPSAGFRSTTDRFKDNAQPTPGYKYVQDKLELDHDHLTASANSAFVSRTERFPEPRDSGPGFKYCVLTDRNPDDPNVQGAYAAFHSTAPRLSTKLPPTTDLPPQHYAATHPSHISEVVRSQENVPSAAFRSKTPRFKDGSQHQPPRRFLDLKDPRDIAQTCAPRDSLKGVPFASTAPRFPEPKANTAVIRSSPLGTIDYTVNVDPAGGCVSAFRSRNPRFKPRPPSGADKSYTYRHPLDIQAQVGNYMAR